VIDFQRIPHQQLSESHTAAFEQCKHSAKIGFKLLYGCRAAVAARLGPIFILFKSPAAQMEAPDQKRYQESGAANLLEQVQSLSSTVWRRKTLLILIKNFSSSAGGAAACSRH
jgi:hypothetical protein